MPKATLEHIEGLVRKAVTDRRFRNKWVTSPLAAAKSEGLDLDKNHVKKLKKLTKALKRFGGNSKLHPDDAVIWSVGALYLGKLIPGTTKDWSPNITSWKLDLRPKKDWSPNITSWKLDLRPKKDWSPSMTSWKLDLRRKR